jgi:2-aminoadipate transaminase
MTMALEKADLLSLAAGFTDNRSLPMPEVQTAVTELSAKLNDPEFLQYGMNQGRLDLRQVLARRLAQQEPEAGAISQLVRQTLITNGSQQALYLAMQVLCDPGDIVLVDRPSYFVFLEMLSGMGIQARCMPIDEQGALDTPALERLLDALAASGELSKLKAVYFVSYFSNPSSRSMTEAEKSHIAFALHRQGRIIPVVEDAAYRDLYFNAPHQARSVLSLPAWEDFPKLYLSTLTKSFATGLKVGFGVCSDPLWLERMLNVKGHQDFGTANFTQAICERVLLNGTFDRHLPKIRALYRRKMQVLHRALETEGLLSLGWQWTPPSGGLYIWLRAPHATGLESKFCQTCLEKGVLYVPGELCFGHSPETNYVRLSFGVLSEEKLIDAAKRFVQAARSLH